MPLLRTASEAYALSNPPSEKYDSFDKIAAELPIVAKPPPECGPDRTIADAAPDTIDLLRFRDHFLQCLRSHCLDFLKVREFPHFQKDVLVYDHPPVYTCEEATRLCPPGIRGGKMKNLFVKDKKKNFGLISALENTRVCLKTGIKQYVDDWNSREQDDGDSFPGSEIPLKGGLSMGNNAQLFEHLALLPGSVSALGIIHNWERVQAFEGTGGCTGGPPEVTFFLDKAAAELEYLAFHPNACNCTVSLRTQDLISFYEKTLGRKVHIVDFSGS